MVQKHGTDKAETWGINGLYKVCSDLKQHKTLNYK